MSKKYIRQEILQDFVYPNNEVSQYDIDIVQDINGNSVSGSVNSFSATTVTATGLTISYNVTWDLNGAEPWIRNSNQLGIVSVHMLAPGQDYYKPWRLVSSISSNTTNLTNLTQTQTATITPSQMGLASFTSGTYYFEVRFIGHLSIYPVCVNLDLSLSPIPTPTPTPTPTGPEPTPTPTATPTATATPTPTTCSLTLFFDVTASPAPGGWDSSALACAGTGTPLTVYVSNTGGCPATFDDVVADGKAIYTNSSLTTLLNGNDKFFKSVSSPSSGKSIQIGTDGFIDTITTC